MKRILPLLLIHGHGIFPYADLRDRQTVRRSLLRVCVDQSRIRLTVQRKIDYFQSKTFMTPCPLSRICVSKRR